MIRDKMSKMFRPGFASKNSKQHPMDLHGLSTAQRMSRNTEIKVPTCDLEEVFKDSDYMKLGPRWRIRCLYLCVLHCLVGGG